MKRTLAIVVALTPIFFGHSVDWNLLPSRVQQPGLVEKHSQLANNDSKGALIPQVNPVGSAELSGLLSRTIVWDNYWFGYWPDKVPNMIRNGLSISARWVRAEKGAATYVFVDQLHSQFRCYGDDFPSVGSVEDYEDNILPGGPRLEEYESEKQRYGISDQNQDISIVLDKDVARVISFGPFDPDKVRKLQGLFHGRVLNKEFVDDVLTSRRKQLRGHPIRVRVGNFNMDSPFIYFYVEGESYLWIIELSSGGKQFVQLEGRSLDDPPHMIDFPYAVKRIDESGAWFTVKDMHLIKE